MINRFKNYQNVGQDIIRTLNLKNLTREKSVADGMLNDLEMVAKKLMKENELGLALSVVNAKTLLDVLIKQKREAR